MIEQLPDDKLFINVLQKFKYSFNLLSKLKYRLQNPSSSDLIHYLLSPLHVILQTLNRKHPTQLQLAQNVWTPALTKEAKELLKNCLTSKELEILHSLGPAWIRST